MSNVAFLLPGHSHRLRRRRLHALYGQIQGQSTRTPEWFATVHLQHLRFHLRRHLIRAMSRPMREIIEALQTRNLIPRSQACNAFRLTPQSLATSVTVRPSAMTSRIALYLCSATLISLMRGSVTNQPK